VSVTAAIMNESIEQPDKYHLSERILGRQKCNWPWPIEIYAQLNHRDLQCFMDMVVNYILPKSSSWLFPDY